ncbi:MAG: hypothetical protein NTV23_07005 [Propionibacteriales bacterium]|nr:hypothetical protein [Propionibacteriales bacterium]
MLSPERDLWSHYEPVHAIVYFDPAVSGCLADAGLHGFWNGYFAGRAAPLGAVAAAPVTALFFGFAPEMVAKALPKVWSRITPAQAVASRLEAVSRTLHPLISDGSLADARRVADLLVRAAEAASYDGRALAAAWVDVDVPDDLAGRLWWAATALREHRGDGHVLAATLAGLSGLETSITHVADGPLARETLQPNRGWTDAEWDAAADSLTARGLLEPGGRGLTGTGRDLRTRIEADTDRLASGPTALLEAEGALVRQVLGGLARAIARAGSLPAGNPMGVPFPAGS